MSAQFVIVIEANLSVSAYGAKISTSEPMDRATAVDLMGRVVLGEAPEIYVPYKKGVTLRLTDTSYLDITTSRATPTRQTRISLAEVVAQRS